jgi:hypothetical protein
MRPIFTRRLGAKSNKKEVPANPFAFEVRQYYNVGIIM